MSTKWSRQRVIDEIRDWHARGIGVDQIWRQNRALVYAAFAHCGSWREALQAAGLESVRQRWSKERVICELRARFSGPGKSGRPVDANTRLRAAAKRYFGSWNQAMDAAGLRPRTRRQMRTWTRDDVIQAIRASEQSGPGPSTLWRSDQRLYSAAKRLFGSWRKALLAAGCEIRRNRQLTRDEVLHEIKHRYAQGQSSRVVSQTQSHLYRSAKRYFGSWHSALEAAGISSRPCRRWTKAEVVQSLRRRHVEGPPLSHTWKDDKPLFRAAVRKFGDWHSAMRAASLETRPYRKWSRERVLDALRSQYRHQPFRVRQMEPALAGAAYRLFGSLGRALHAAGLEPPPRRWTHQRVIERIQDGHVSGRPIHQAGFGERTLAAAAKRHFGGWRAAVAAAGLAAKLPPPVAVRAWSPQAVIDEIVRCHRQSLPLTDLWKRDTGLYSAAKKHFGSWRAAVVAAGIEPPRRQWSPPDVIRDLRARESRGLSLSSGAVFRDDCRLGGATMRFFGSWSAALAAAGITRTRPQPASRKPRKGNSTCSAKK